MSGTTALHNLGTESCRLCSEMEGGKVCHAGFSYAVIIVVGKIYSNLEVNRSLENNQYFSDVHINGALFSEAACKRSTGSFDDLLHCFVMV